jgi:diamine N-acetyltransferase
MITIRKVEIAEADTLLVLSKKTFYEFFAHLNDEANMEAYASVAFTPQCILDQLTNPDSEFYFALYEDDIVGYMKLNFNDAQNEFKDNDALEIERIYVSGEHHGKRIGKLLLDFAINIARNKQFDYVWLGVWEHNYKAMGFYEHNGFELCGSHEFLLGGDKQTDLLMRKELV